ncbi:MAG: hypothetical protein HZC55_26525 [Verrucomicrobia bacterium]|nr:hypothetical protein [Verrucomicrobiota bacterium]
MSYWNINDGLFSSVETTTTETLVFGTERLNAPYRFVRLNDPLIGRTFEVNGAPAPLEMLIRPDSFDDTIRIDASVSASATASGPVSVSDSGLGPQVQTFSFEVQTLRPEDILRNSVRPIFSGATAGFLFEPNYKGIRLSLQEAAAVLDVDHFNWTNELIRIPTDWTVDIVDRWGNLFAANPSPIMDPVILPDLLRYRVTKHLDGAASLTGFINTQQSGFWDPLPFYFGEDPSRRGEPGHVSTVTSENALYFDDTPSLLFYPNELRSYPLPNDYYIFETRLVGVGELGNLVELPEGLGLRHQWFSNGVRASGIGAFSVVDPSLLDPIIFGEAYLLGSDAPGSPNHAPDSFKVLYWLSCVIALFFRLKSRRPSY